MTDVVLGASGGLGKVIAAELVRRGRTVRAVNRAGDADVPGAERRAADLEAPGGAAEAIAGADVVYMAAQPPWGEWPERFPAMLGSVIDACGSAGLVMVDNLYAYGAGSSPITEQRPEAATDVKGRTRAALGRMLLDAHRSGKAQVAIGRLSDYFGPDGGNSYLAGLVFGPYAAGKRMRWVGSLDAPHSFAYLPDAGRAYADLGASDAAYGRVWIMPHLPAVTGREFLRLVGENGAVKTGLISPLMMRLVAPFNRTAREAMFTLYQFTDPFVADSSRFEAEIGPFTTTPIEQAIAETIAAGGAGG